MEGWTDPFLYDPSITAGGPINIESEHLAALLQNTCITNKKQCSPHSRR